MSSFIINILSRIHHSLFSLRTNNFAKIIYKNGLTKFSCYMYLRALFQPPLVSKLSFSINSRRLNAAPTIRGNSFYTFYPVIVNHGSRCPAINARVYRVPCPFRPVYLIFPRWRSLKVK